MRLTLPIYVCESGSGNNHSFRIRPLFAPARAQVIHSNFKRGLQDLQRELNREATALALTRRPESLAEWSYAPVFQEIKVNLRVTLGKTTSQTKALGIRWHAGERKLGAIAMFSHLWFEPGNDFNATAADVLTRYFKSSDEDPEDLLNELQDRCSESITYLDLEFNAAAKLPEPRPLFAFFGQQEEKLSGFEQLERVGRCLDRLYPDALSRAILRDTEVNELHRTLYGAERRAVLLVGARNSGKSAIVQEMVYQRRKSTGGRHGGKQCVWLIAPQRLISGMMYVGQWEQRLLAIIEQSKTKRHILYFDDLLGLFQAGRSAQSDLNVAMVLRPYLERRELRVLGEITPEALRILRERDRAFADLFHLLPVRETGERETLRILCAAQQEIEADQKHTISSTTLPALYDITRRFQPDSAFPGKAVSLMKEMVVSRDNLSSPEYAWFYFARRHGLGSAFARQCGWPKLAAPDEIGKEVIGQQIAVETICRHLALASSGLRDPSRPVGVFLFVGPTGVGKTELATVITRHLFENTENLVRFDMNEFCGYDAVARLAGTFHQPEGLLTNAIRRRPVCVLLLDEIEKADPGVLDLLLQVLGEGRLTDALGRTTDFTNTIIIMTSNLGVREEMSQVGFGGESSDGSELRFLGAVRRYFRPEFFNRIDAVVPFHALKPEHVLQIANLQLIRLLDRHGLSQRRCWFQIDSSAEKLVAEEGYNPQMGARALKRTIERLLTRPLAGILSARTGDTPVIVSVRAEAGSIAARVQEFRLAEPVRKEEERIEDEESIQAALDRVNDALEHLRPEGAVSVTDPPKEAVFYFALREKLSWIQRQLRRDRSRSRRSDSRRPALPDINRQAQNPLRKIRFHEAKMGQMIRRQLTFRELLDAVSDDSGGTDSELSTLQELANECRLVETMAADATDLKEERFVVISRQWRVHRHDWGVLNGLSRGLKWVPGSIVESLDDPDLVDSFFTRRPTGSSFAAFTVTGISLSSLLSRFRGLYLRGVDGGNLSCEQIEILPIEAATSVSLNWLEQQESRLAEVTDLEVIRLITSEGMIDLRSGLLSRNVTDEEANHKMLAASLP